LGLPQEFQQGRSNAGNQDREVGVTLINCDMGEAFGLYKMGDDEGLMPLIDVANVACGFHASDFNHMRKTVRLPRSMA
jgi:lactam utilization protein B